MAIIKINDLISDVRIALDENDVQNTLLAGAEYTLQLDDIIRSKIVDALDVILQNAPLELLGGGRSLTDGEKNAITWSSFAGGVAQDGEMAWCRFSRPADYMRLVIAKCRDWVAGVRQTIGEDSDAYAMQKSEFAGVRGNPARPIVADVEGAEGRVIEMYSSRSRDVLFKYVKTASSMIESESRISLPDERLYRILVYQVAGLTLITLREDNHAQTMFALAQGMLDSQAMKNKLKETQEEK